MAGHTLTLGSGGQKPAYSADPSHGLGPFGSGGSLLLKCCINSTLPYLGGELRAVSLAWYLKLNASPPGGVESWIFRMSGHALSSAGFEVRLTPSGTVKVYASWSGGNDELESAALGVGDEAFFVFTRAASNLEGSGKSRLYTNGTLSQDVARGGNSVASSTQPSFYWGADTVGFTSSTGAPVIIGRTRIFDGELSAEQIAGMYARARLTYSNLPPA